METPNKFILLGKTKHGKNRLRELRERHPGFTGVWVEKSRRNWIAFNPSKEGPWVFIRPVMGPGDHIMSEAWNERWIHLNDDRDFAVLPDPITTNL